MIVEHDIIDEFWKRPTGTLWIAKAPMETMTAPYMPSAFYVGADETAQLDAEDVLIYVDRRDRWVQLMSRAGFVEVIVNEFVRFFECQDE